VYDFELTKRMLLRSAASDIFSFSFCRHTEFVRHCAAAFFLQVPKSCTDLDPTLLYIPISGTCSKFERKNKIDSAPRLHASHSLIWFKYLKFLHETDSLRLQNEFSIHFIEIERQCVQEPEIAAQ